MTAGSVDDTEYSDELLAAIGFVNEFQFASSQTSELPEVAAAGVDGSIGAPEEPEGELVSTQRGTRVATTELHDADALALVSLEELSSEEIEELSSVVAESSSTTAAHSRKVAVDQQNQQECEQQIQVSDQTPHKKKKKLPWDPNKARNARREEPAYLRKRVADLETQLAETQAKQSPHSTTTTLIAGCRSSSCTASARARTWEEIATNQLAMRTKAERKNIRLKLVLESQLKIARSLEKHLGRATSTQEIRRCFAASQIREMHPPLSQSDSETTIFNELLVGTDQSYAEVDTVFEANGLANSETSHLNTQMRSKSSGTFCLEIFATKVLPFEYHATVNTVWDHFVFAKERIPTRHYYNKSPKVFLRPTSSYIKNFHLEFHVKSMSANFGVKQVIRRFDEPDRVVIVWRLFIDPIVFCDEPLVGVRFLEKGCVMIKKLKKISDAFTLLQPCYVISPLFSEKYEEGNHPKAGAMTDFVLSVTAANIRATNQMIEDSLLPQAKMMNSRRNICGGGGDSGSDGSFSVSEQHFAC